MLTARLVIECPDQAQVDGLADGLIDLQIVAVEAGIPGELLASHLLPLRVEALSTLAAVDPPDERQGPLVRVFLRCPGQEANDG